MLFALYFTGFAVVFEYNLAACVTFSKLGRITSSVPPPTVPFDIVVVQKCFVVVLVYYCNSIIVDRTLGVLPSWSDAIVRGAGRAVSDDTASIYYTRDASRRTIKSNATTLKRDVHIFFLVLFGFILFLYSTRWLINACRRCCCYCRALYCFGPPVTVRVCSKYLCKSKNPATRPLWRTAKNVILISPSADVHQCGLAVSSECIVYRVTEAAARKHNNIIILSRRVIKTPKIKSKCAYMRSSSCAY